MNICIERQACCAQDDQTNPLEKIVDGATLGDVLERARAAPFFQFSSTHAERVCLAGQRAVARLFAHKANAYLVPPDTPLQTVAPDGALRCIFMHEASRHVQT